MIDLVWSLLVYTFCWLVSYILARVWYIKKDKMPLWLNILISLLFTYYCFFSMASEDAMVGDRQNYIQNFEGNRESPSLGLMAMINFVHYINGDFKTLLYISMFVSVFVTLLAYKYSKVAKPDALLLLFVSQYVLTALTALKQCYASAFASLAFVLMLQNKRILKELLIVLLIILACLFHPSGYILVPIYLIIRYVEHRKMMINKIIFLLVIVGCLFIPIMQFIPSMTSSFFPFLADKVDEYFVSKDQLEGSFITLFKGLPIYIITITILRYRDRLVTTIPYFNGYMVVTLMCAFVYLMNVYDVWMSRFIYLFQLVVYVFFIYASRYIPRGKEIVGVVTLTSLFFTYRFLILTGGFL